MKPADGWLTPDGKALKLLGAPPAEPVLCIFMEGECAAKVVLRAVDRAWLRQQLAPFDHKAVEPPPSCYDCAHCALRPPKGHVCTAPVPAWTQTPCNDAIPVIEDAEHDATMAVHCSLFKRKA